MFIWCIKKIKHIYKCDYCGLEFNHEPIYAHGKKRILYFCSLKCKSKYLKGYELWEK